MLTFGVLTNLGILAQSVRAAMTADSYRVRLAALKFLQVFVPRHSFLLTVSHFFACHSKTVACCAA